MLNEPLHPHRRYGSSNSARRDRHIEKVEPNIGRVVTLKMRPNVFVLLEDATCNDAARKVFAQLSNMHAGQYVMRFYTANCVEEIDDYVRALESSITAVPVVITGVSTFSSFKPRARTALANRFFEKKSLPNKVDWLIEIGSNLAEKHFDDCLGSLNAWFGGANFKGCTLCNRSKSIVAPWGKLPAKDWLIGCDRATLQPRV